LLALHRRGSHCRAVHGRVIAGGDRRHQGRGGPDKAYAEISDPAGPFVDRDLYVVVYGLDGMVLAHGADAKRIGTNQIDDTDPDAKRS
jgi:hypothetical protein